MSFFRAVTGGTGNRGWVFAWAVMGGTGVNGLRTLCYLKNIACMYFSYTCMFSYLNVIGSKDVRLVFNTTWVQKIAKKTKEKA